MRRAMLYLGLGPDEEYDEFGRPAPAPAPGPGAAPAPEPPSSAEYSNVRPAAAPAESPGIRVVPDPTPTPVPDRAPVSEPPAAVGGPPAHSVVRTVPPPTRSAEPKVVMPTSFAEAQVVADTFKGRQPVIVNLQDVDADLSRRLIDFASGMCYALDGRMEKVATRVYLLKPADVEVADAERQRLHDRGYSD